MCYFKDLPVELVRFLTFFSAFARFLLHIFLITCQRLQTNRLIVSSVDVVDLHLRSSAGRDLYDDFLSLFVCDLDQAWLALNLGRVHFLRDLNFSFTALTI